MQQNAHERYNCNLCDSGEFKKSTCGFMYSELDCLDERHTCEHEACTRQAACSQLDNEYDGVKRTYYCVEHLDPFRPADRTVVVRVRHYSELHGNHVSDPD
jgi:hypothetical protein